MSEYNYSNLEEGTSSTALLEARDGDFFVSNGYFFREMPKELPVNDDIVLIKGKITVSF